MRLRKQEIRRKRKSQSNLPAISSKCTRQYVSFETCKCRKSVNKITFVFRDDENMALIPAHVF